MHAGSRDGGWGVRKVKSRQHDTRGHPLRRRAEGHEHTHARQAMGRAARKRRLAGRGRHSAVRGDRAPLCCWIIMTAAAGSRTVAVATGHGDRPGLAGRRRRAFGRRRERRRRAAAAGWTHSFPPRAGVDPPVIPPRLGPEFPLRAPRAHAQGGARRRRTGSLLLAATGWVRAGGPAQRRRKDGRVHDGRCCRFCVATDDLCNQPGAASAACRQQAALQ